MLDALISSGQEVTFQDRQGAITKLFFPSARHEHDESSGPAVVITTPKIQVGGLHFQGREVPPCVGRGGGVGPRPLLYVLLELLPSFD